MTEPYYSDDLVTLYLGDCREITEWLAADVLVSDPPYGMNLRSGMKGVAAGDMRIVGDDTTEVRDAALTLWRARPSDPPALVFSRWNLPVPSAKQCLVWDKGEHVGMGDLNVPWKPNWEPIYVLGTWPPRTVRRGTSVIRALAMAGTIQGDRGKPWNGRDHATGKPVGLMQNLVAACPPGSIADPFAGSGSTLVAAKMLGRKAIGVEIEERHCETAARRLLQDALPFEVTT